MKLITELNENVQYKLREEIGGVKKLYIEGIFIQGDLVNKNGRVYPMSILEPVVERYIAEKVVTNRAFGELTHPTSPEINPDRISHRIIELKKDGSNYVGKALVASTPCGLIVKGIIEDGGSLAVSTRGVGSLEEKNGVSYVQDDFILNTAADIVIDPSAPDAFVNGIMEGKEWTLHEGVIREVLPSIKKNIEKAVRINKYNLAERKREFVDILGKYLKSI